ncbi:ABC transporter ATP-binding protein [Staphylococcus massiliensis]|uniref:ABC transporter n=1 Tax=Staphylococcus massiliensis S46 TaxID=1229783 RepID=K9B6D7_9STAP|nr:ABC transporter ATP-binding protein [Staphylococcus massiliensis]EKU50362.1 ABC transporter [Staphylococcus massiliensis S46]MCG3400577.1 ABC transporter ATP-binding protein [Staphylococcus massiliensis]MCG3401430.1 ABC transporter ATP-binding protein [Staphylococcus massiliensis]MCG3411787.1 ABC transporter ATP-binding protein [Staphylococcus massiliensis]
MANIKVQNLTKHFGSHQVLDQVNLSIEQGEVYGLLGKNGAGKSTLINIITGFIEPSSGQVHITTPKAKIGVLPDYNTMYNNLTGLEHMVYFNRLLKAKKSKEALISILKRVGLEDGIETKVKNYSFGMKKKLGVAQALINDPDLVFLDEPTSGVDANSVLAIHAVMKDLAHNGTTVCYTSHNLDEVEKLSDKIGIMANGHIEIDGSLEEIRAAYLKEIQVTFKVPKLERKDYHTLSEAFKNELLSIQYDEGSLIVCMVDQTCIPKINNQLVHLGYSVYGIQVHEPSLEEIFINM